MNVKNAIFQIDIGMSKYGYALMLKNLSNNDVKLLTDDDLASLLSKLCDNLTDYIDNHF